jgi:hypothetical protein
MIKVYEAVCARVLSVPVTITGKEARIVFNQGDSFINANYRTSDKAVQQALEESPLFGSDYVLRHAIGEESDVERETENVDRETENVERETENVERETENGATTPVVEKPKPAGRPKKRPTENGERETVEPEQNKSE